MKKDAVLSDDRLHRYSLSRIWDEDKPFVLFIGLNPSTANETEDDRTLKRCIQFAKDWGYGGVQMCNLFSYRTKSPKVMMKYHTPTNSSNDGWLEALADQAGIIVCAWGADGGYKNRDKEVINLLSLYYLECLGKTKEGYPRHPLYVRADKELEVFA